MDWIVFRQGIVPRICQGAMAPQGAVAVCGQAIEQVQFG
jgi:hypothetical protein